MSRKDDKGSRFDGFLKAARQGKAAKPDEEILDVETFEHLNVEDSNTETSGHSDIQTSEHRNIQLAKSKDPHYQRTTIYIPKPLHKKLKAIAAVDESEISDIVEKLIQEWVENRKQNLDV